MASWTRFVPYIGYHHVIMMFLATAIIFLSILLAGCSTSGLSNVYLLSLSYVNNISSPAQIDQTQVNPNISAVFANLVGANTSASLEVRAGYFGLCMKQSAGWVCDPSAETLANIIKDANGDPLNLIWLAKNFKSQIVTTGLIFTSIPLVLICFLLLYTFPGWHEEEDDDNSEREVKPFPSKQVSNVALAVVAVASILTLLSAFWQHISSSAAAVLGESLSYGTVEGHVGAVAMVLGWGALLVELLATVALLIMILSIRILEKMTL